MESKKKPIAGDELTATKLSSKPSSRLSSKPSSKTSTRQATTRSAETKSAATRLEATKPDATRSEVARPEAARPEATRSEVARPEATRPAETKPATNPAATKPAATKRLSTKPLETRPSTTKPPEAKPSVTKSPAAKPVVTKPSVAKLSVAKPSATESSATKSPAAKSSAIKTTKSPATQPVASKAPETKPATKSVTKSPTKPATKSVTKSPTKPATKPATQSLATKSPIKSQAQAPKPATKPAPDTCLMQQALSLLKCNDDPESDKTIDTVNNLIRHVRTNCRQCPKQSAYMVIGVYYFQMFKSRLEKFKSEVIERDLTPTNEKQPIEKENEKKNEIESEKENWDKLKIKNSGTFSLLINLESQKKLLEYLFKTIDIWRKVLVVKEHLNAKLIDQLEVFDILRSCYYIFSFYGVTKYVKYTCTVYSELVLLHGQAFKHHLLFAYYCQIRTYLDYGLLEKARNYLKTGQNLIEKIPKTIARFIVNETYLIRIADCELKLLTGENVEEAAADLKKIINDKHFESPTVWSGYVKCLACVLLCKFPAKQCPDQNLAYHFNECFTFTRVLVNKWYPFLFTPLQTERQANERQKSDEQKNDGQTKQPDDEKADDKQASDKQANDQQTGDKKASDQQANDKQTNEKQASDQQANDKQASDQQANDQQANDQQANGNQSNDQKSNDNQTNKQANDQQAIDRQVTIISPIWQEFALTKFFLEFMLTYYYYAVNSSVVDTHFYFNILAVRLSRIYGSLLWISRHLLLSIHYEKPAVQKAKINQVRKLFNKKSGEANKSPMHRPTVGNLPAPNRAMNRPETSSESLVMQDDCPERAWKEPVSCSHSEETPICLLKKSLMKRPVLDHDVEIEVLTKHDYEAEMESLDDYPIPELIVVRQEFLLLLYQINESKAGFSHYFKQLDLDNLTSIYLESLSTALDVNFDSLNRNHPNLITSQFGMRCLLIYLQTFELEPPATADLTRNLLRKATKLGHSYEIHCFIAELMISYVDSQLGEICSGQLNIPEYDFLECDKYLATQQIYESSSPVRSPVKLRSRAKPSAPKKAYQYKMEEVRDYIKELYELDSVENRPKSAVKLNFTDSDEEEGDPERDKENLRKKLSKLKKDRSSQKEATDRRKSADRRRESADQSEEATSAGSQKVIGKSRQPFTVRKESKPKVRSSRDSNLLSDLNNLTEQIGKLGFDDTFEQETHEYLIDESSDDYNVECRRLLHKVLDLFGNSPPIKHYNLIVGLLFRLSICKESTFGHESAYYFSEFSQTNGLRYQTLEHLQRKSKKVPIKYESGMLGFAPISEVECKDALSKMIDMLPPNWRVLQIQFVKGVGSQSDLYLARYQRARDPVFLKINVNSEKLCQNFTVEFNEIIKMADAAIKEKDSKAFWRLRYSLDERMRRLMIDVNSTWINCFIGMFLGECSSVKLQEVSEQIERHLMSYAKANHLRCVSPDLLRVICESFIHLKEESFNHALVSLFEPKNPFENVYDECLGLLRKRINFGTLAELRETVTKRIRFGPLALITGSMLENFPFESLSYLRTLTQEIFRVPSVRFLNWMYVNLPRTNQRVKQGVSDRDVYYLVNPTQNLQYTEEKFKGPFEELKKRDSCSWDGLVGQIPPQKELQKVLQNKDIYIYLGHNSGMRYLGRLNESVVNCLSLVMGCSSAAVSNSEQMVESFGASYYFLMNGCPTYVGCLWNVTDRDIDHFCELLLKKTFPVYDSSKTVTKCPSITRAVPMSRDVCKLKYLNGAAPVVCGLPISMRVTEDCGS